jgi:hypothetical protein
MPDQGRGDEQDGESPAQAPIPDLEQYRRQTERRLILGGVAIVILVGGALILLLFDAGALAGAWICLGAMALPIAAIIGALLLFQWLGREPRNHR